MRNTDNKSISLEPGLLRRAKRMAKEKGFKNSFSAYVAYLIARDLTLSGGEVEAKGNDVIEGDLVIGTGPKGNGFKVQMRPKKGQVAA